MSEVTLETHSVTQALGQARRLGLRGRLRITRLRRGLGRGIWARLVGPWWRVTIEEVGEDEVLELGNGLRCTWAELVAALEAQRVRDVAEAEAARASACWACGHPLREHVYNGAESRCGCGCDRAYQVRP